MPPPKKPLRPQTDEPKSRSWPCKNAFEKRVVAKPIEDDKISKKAHAEEVAAKKDDKNELAQAIVQTKRMKIHPFRDLKPRTDLGGTSGVNPLGDGFVRPAYEFAKSVTETSSKVQKLKTYNEAINNPIHRNKWREAVDKELWNLDIHQT